MATPEHYARKEELIQEISERRELIKGLTQQIRPLIEELEALKDFEILEISEGWLDSREKIDAILDRAWDNGRGNRMASELIEQHLVDIKPEGVGMWHQAGHYEVEGRDVRVISVYLGLNYATNEEEIEGIAEAIRKLCDTIGDTGEDYYLPIMDHMSNASYVLHPATNEIRYQSWGAETSYYKGDSLEDALDHIATTLPYDGDDR